MSDTSEAGSRVLSNADLARVLSPLLFFAAHVLYLLLWSPDPFLKKWIDGSFTFFIALVLCNVIRARVVAARADEEHDMHGADHPDQTGGHAGSAGNTRAGDEQASR